MNWKQWSMIDAGSVLAQLHSGVHGLTNQEARARLKRYGYNEIVNNSHTARALLVQQISSPFNYLLLGAAVFACVVGEWKTGILMFCLATFNIGLGFYQEFKAHRALWLLRTFLQADTIVLRDEKEVTIHPKNVVPGDILVINTGSTMPADVRILDEQELVIDESILTGESIPVAKVAQALGGSISEIFQAKNIAFAGTTVISGSARAVIIATGAQTEMNQIADITPESMRISTYEQNLKTLSKLLVRIALVFIAAIFAAQLMFKVQENFVELVIFVTALVLALVPIALPTVVTFALSQSAVRLAEKKVIVKRLSSIEDLGDLEILCVDKTGTLTEYTLNVDEVVSQNTAQCLLYLLLGENTTKSSRTRHSFFSDAIALYAPEQVHTQIQNYSIVHVSPFDTGKMVVRVHAVDKNGQQILVVRGAPETVLSISSFSSQTERDMVHQQMRAHGVSGKRVLAVAYKLIEKQSAVPLEAQKDFSFAGFISFTNPIKQGTPETLAIAQKLGVAIKMITGDTAEVAGFVAHQVGILKDASDVVTGAQLNALSPLDFADTCRQKTVFARIEPAMKARIVSALQKHAEVGFLGEGMNDVPALRQANVALVVKDAVGIARESADIILLQPDIHVMINGIRYGRTVFANISKYIRCSLAGSLGNYYSVALFSLLLPFLPLLPAQLLLVNILSDLPLLAIASDTVDPHELRTPKNYQLKKTLLLIVLLGITGTLSDFLFLRRFHLLSPAQFRTLWFEFNVLSEIMLIFSIRTERFFLRARRPSMPLMAMAALSALVCISVPLSAWGTAWFSFVAPERHEYFALSVLLALFFGMAELVKYAYFRYTNTGQTKSL